VLSCVSSGLTAGCSPIQGVLPAVCRIHNFCINFEWEQAIEPNPSRKKKKKKKKKKFELMIHVFASWKIALPLSSA
jgi:hypothetical protein